MKRTGLLFFAGLVILLSSCETTKEISLRDDGSGILTTTNDMSGMIGLAKMSGQTEELDKLKDERAVDTTIAMVSMADNLDDLSIEERDIIRKGTLGLNMDIKNEKFITQLTFPFTNTKDIPALDKLSSKIIVQVMKKQMESSGGAGGTGMPEGMPKEGIPDGSLDDYFTTTYSKGLIERKLIPEKYAGVADDEKMKGLKELSGMGVGNNKLILYLPSVAKKAEGKNVTLSEDKKKVTIMSSTEDFFEDGKALEFRIEY